MNSIARVLLTTASLSAFAVLPPGCGQNSTPNAASDAGHSHDDHGESHDGHKHSHAADDDHGHEQDVALESITLGGLTIGLAQGHGEVAAGRELLLVVKLPYSDNGATVIRAWLGTEDRLASLVAKGQYAPSHDDYDIHAVAPDPLPVNTMWWIEIEKPDGEKLLGSAKPI